MHTITRNLAWIVMMEEGLLIQEDVGYMLQSFNIELSDIAV